MISAFKGVIIGILLTIMAITATQTMLTGTDSISTMLQIMIPMVVGFGVLVYIITAMFRAGRGE